jgi:hypothetical protein
VWRAARRLAKRPAEVKTTKVEQIGELLQPNRLIEMLLHILGHSPHLPRSQSAWLTMIEKRKRRMLAQELKAQKVDQLFEVEPLMSARFLSLCRYQREDGE